MTLFTFHLGASLVITFIICDVIIGFLEKNISVLFIPFYLLPFLQDSLYLRNEQMGGLSLVMENNCSILALNLVIGIYSFIGVSDTRSLKMIIFSKIKAK